MIPAETMTTAPSDSNDALDRRVRAILSAVNECRRALIRSHNRGYPSNRAVPVRTSRATWNEYHKHLMRRRSALAKAEPSRLDA